MQKKIVGIYILQNIITKTVVVGQSVDCHRRHLNYLSLLKRNVYPNLHLQSSWNKHGKENFKFEILQEVSNIDFLTSYEQSYLDYYRTLPAGVYNQVGPADNPLIGFKHSNESKAKISKNNGRWLTGKTHTPEVLAKLSESHKRLTYSRSIEYRAKLSLRMKGRALTQAQKLKMSIARKGIKTKPCTEETKLKIANTLKNHKVSSETREKQRQARLKFIALQNLTSGIINETNK